MDIPDCAKKELDKIELGLIPEAMGRIFSNLTPSQLEMYDAVEWLLNPNSGRREGRTELMAVSFIKQSLQRNEWVKVFDHTLGLTGAYVIVSRVKKISDIAGNLSVAIKKNMNGYPEIKISVI